MKIDQLFKQIENKKFSIMSMQRLEWETEKIERFFRDLGVRVV